MSEETLSDARDVVVANAKSILQFTAYLNDVGFTLGLIGCAIDCELDTKGASEIVNTAISDVTGGLGIEVIRSDPDAALKRVIDGGASFALLVAFIGSAEMLVSAEEITIPVPAENVPSNDVVQAILELFYEGRRVTELESYQPNRSFLFD